MAAGLKTLELISEPDFFEALTKKTAQLAEGFKARASEAGVPLTVNYVGGMFGLFFTGEPAVTRFAQAVACDQEYFKRFFHAMLESGVYLAPSAFEAGFVSAAHSDTDIERTLDTAAAAFARL
jgi:glutamate-1-semialdehyde 2,1-aminomutase